MVERMVLFNLVHVEYFAGRFQNSFLNYLFITCEFALRLALTIRQHALSKKVLEKSVFP